MAVDSIILPRAVLYDWDNTLVDNWGTVRAALNHALDAFGLPTWDEEEARARIKQSLRDSFPRIFGERWTEARDLFYAYFAAHHLDHLRPLSGAEDLLRCFDERGVYQAVVSNKTGRFLRAEAEALGWGGFFGALVGAQDAAFDKPHIAPVRMALEPSGLEPGPQVWFLGDADIDMECAHGAGLIPVLIGQGEGSGFDRFPPAHRHADCAALCGLVGCGLVGAGGDTISVQSGV
ncbi:HAD family hydrolase [Azospirillum griseum]|uniref:phosphoglycolate phosphatase n=1 Tax=Azospirillum griseum TaxID=2496639 RepID=A0A431VMS0_9PROT|nr:HAD family hydrolase [Azospirillum griseum]RTR23645.1 HAD family hydrolase [Azospirillum griseum]